MTQYFTASDAFHDSRLAACRWPQGALPAGESVRLCLYLSERLRGAYCLLCWQHDGQEGIALMEPRKEESGRLCYAAVLSFDRPGLARYWFIVNDGRRLLYYGGAGSTGGLGVLTSSFVTPYQITVYDPAYRTPSWFRNAVVYQIFPDRFARGKGRGSLNRADFHRKLGRTVVLHENWNEQPLYQPLPGREYYDPCDFFGGDLEGIIEKLPCLQELGVTCLYLNPIFESPTNHKYNTGNYRAVDPMFGDEETFRRLCLEARRLGMRVLLDGVFSHTGDDSLYFNKYCRYDSVGACNSPDSPYYSWYTFLQYPTVYQSWWGFSSLPEVNEHSASYQDFIARDEDAVLKHWIRQGASGWRLDVADELPDDFIALLRRELKQTDPEALLLGEVWEDASNKFSMNCSRRYVFGNELDSVMNYPLREAILGFFLGKMTAEQAVGRMETLRENYPPAFFYSCLNLLSSHDVPRALSLLSGAPDKDSGLSREEQAAFELTEDQRSLGRTRLLLATALQMCLPGAPCVYYGDEAGAEGLMDPFNRGTYPWGKEDSVLLEGFARWIGQRRRSAVLRTGRMLLLSPHRDVIAVVRFVPGDGKDALGDPCEKGLFLLAVNRSASSCGVRLDFTAALHGPDASALPDLGGRYRCVESVGTAPVSVLCKNGVMRFVLPALSACLLVREEKSSRLSKV